MCRRSQTRDDEARIVKLMEHFSLGQLIPGQRTSVQAGAVHSDSHPTAQKRKSLTFSTGNFSYFLLSKYFYWKLAQTFEQMLDDLLGVAIRRSLIIRGDCLQTGTSGKEGTFLFTSFSVL